MTTLDLEPGWVATELGFDLSIAAQLCLKINDMMLVQLRVKQDEKGDNGEDLFKDVLVETVYIMGRPEYAVVEFPNKKAYPAQWQLIKAWKKM
jgi:hypothetical protein